MGGIVFCSNLELLDDFGPLLGRFLQSRLDVLNAVVVPGVKQPAHADDGYGPAGHGGVLDCSPSVDAGDEGEDGGDEDVGKGRVEGPEGPEAALSRAEAFGLGGVAVDLGTQVGQRLLEGSCRRRVCAAKGPEGDHFCGLLRLDVVCPGRVGLQGSSVHVV